MDTLELECGVVLELQAVRRMPLLDLLENLPIDDITKIDVTQISIRDLNSLMRYLCGWGIKNEIPEDQRDSLAIFGKGEHIQRAAWVRLIATESELTTVFARILALTQLNVAQPTPEQTAAQPTPEQVELEALRAKVQELEQDGSE